MSSSVNKRVTLDPALHDKFFELLHAPLRTPYNYDLDAASAAHGLTCEDESRAIQSERDACDINTIVRNFGVTGQVVAPMAPPSYRDLPEVYDFHTAMNFIQRSHDAFDTLPALTRERFGNDPGRFVEFFNDPNTTRAQLEEVGLVGPASASVAPPPGAATPPASEGAAPPSADK